ncbi:MAG: RNA methyltransferase [Clostridia bacterium]|nr:RNA methyltransferase [Clostridia bacterium]
MTDNPSSSILISENEAVFEGMTSISSLIQAIRDGESDRKIRAVYFDHGRLYKKQSEFRFLQAVSRELSFELLVTDADQLSSIVSGNTHGGVVAIASERTYPQLTSEDLSEKGFWVLPDGIEDPYNFGYSIRSLYAAGVDGIVLPPRNWLSAAGTVARSSAGTSEKIKIRIADPKDAVNLFRASGYRVLAAEIRDSVSLYDADLRTPLLFVIGGEKRGISREVLALCDQNVRIEYGRAFRGSLSAAATCAIIGFEVFRRNQ